LHNEYDDRFAERLPITLPVHSTDVRCQKPSAMQFVTGPLDLRRYPPTAELPADPSMTVAPHRLRRVPSRRREARNRHLANRWKFISRFMEIHFTIHRHCNLNLPCPPVARSGTSDVARCSIARTNEMLENMNELMSDKRPRVGDELTNADRLPTKDFSCPSSYSDVGVMPYST
jgi:hypothetical protein